MKKLFAIGLFALGLGAGAASAAEIHVHIGSYPPPREVIVVRPGPRHGWHRDYDDDDYYRGRDCDRGGYYVRPHARRVWVPGYWAPRRHGRIFIQGYWRY